MATEKSDKEPLLAETPGGPAAIPPPSSGNLLKYGSLGFLILQNSSHVLLLRYSRIVPGECHEYIVSVAVLFAELLKLVFCLCVLIVKEGGPCSALALLDADIWQRKADTAKVAVPALCYTLQNNLQFVAASHLGAELLQLLYQTKTLSTAIFGVVILSKQLRCNQWCALLVLICGVVAAQSSQKPSAGGMAKGSLVGVMAALGVSGCSGFASVYLEKILKGDKTSLCARGARPLPLCPISPQRPPYRLLSRPAACAFAVRISVGICVGTRQSLRERCGTQPLHRARRWSSRCAWRCPRARRRGAQRAALHLLHPVAAPCSLPARLGQGPLRSIPIAPSLLCHSAPSLPSRSLHPSHPDRAPLPSRHPLGCGAIHARTRPYARHPHGRRVCVLRPV
jgi:drug/metabolite transporter (DMT)-like permease